MPSFLLELFSEEIPARMQVEAAEHLKQTLGKALLDVGYFNFKYKSFVTPRRLAIEVDSLPLLQPDISEELKGPKVGAQEAALAGFLKKTGLSKNQLEERDGVYFANIQQKGHPTAEVLKPLIEEILAKFPWPKSMRWGSRSETWVRPLHSILCILGSDIIPVEFAGVKAGNKTYGHRFLAPQAITVADAAEYEKKLESAFVIADRDARKNKIKVSLEEKAAKHSLNWKEDQALLEEVTGLVEWPVIMFGNVDAQFMHLPPELLTTVMRSHQKYFTLNDKAGKFSSTFAFAANRDTATNGKEIIAGNERVLRARFSDAKFFYEQDQKKTLAEWNTGLSKVTFHAKIGTVAEKVKGIENLAFPILRKLQQVEGSKDSSTILGMTESLKTAVRLCKADLTTGMVGEFPELQGIIGSYYARAEGMNDDVAEALYHLYDHPKDLKNLGQIAQILCIADRLDSLIRLFAIGEKPTGSKDPYALRRAALGVIAIIRNHGLRINFQKSSFESLLYLLLDDIEQKSKAILAKQKQDIEQQLKRSEEDDKYMDALMGFDMFFDTFQVKTIVSADSMVQSNTQVQKKPESINIQLPSIELKKEVANKITIELLTFLSDRLEADLLEQGIEHTTLRAIGGLMQDGDIVRVEARANALQEFLKTTESAAMLAAYRRADNILAIEQKKDNTVYAAQNLQKNLLKEDAEKQLQQALDGVTSMIQPLFAAEDFAAVMKQFANLKAPLDTFFDKIMVNSDDAALRANRLSLLAAIMDTMNQVADFSKITA